ncbi:peptidyl-prolyl cis-trans isomerase [Paenibacillus sp. Marseille-Q4541]|uniref:peptidylprolyl isomerase n=1 Tax=Paenibacillus sp. Marseille-Q4541 TaxID=2831522 RepID=UPI001BA51CCD|nr:peptidyl-prolyl cis-trans isomerase [Paenibacillus sp. Marseille-Q4541]
MGFGNSQYPQKIETSQTVAWVNGVPIESREFEAALLAERIGVISYFQTTYGAEYDNRFWNTLYGGEKPIEILRRKALDACVRNKVQQMEAIKYGILDEQGASYTTFLHRLTDENNRREEAVKRNEVIYGPTQYEEQDFYSYLLSNVANKLKEQLVSGELALTTEELETFYDRKKDQMFMKSPYIKMKKVLVPLQSGGNSSIQLAEKIRKNAIELKSLKQAVNKWDKDLQVTEQVFDDKSKRDDNKYFPEILEAVNVLKSGEVSEVIPVPEGNVVIEIVERRDYGYVSYSEVKDQVRSMLIDEKYASWLKKKIKQTQVKVNSIVYEETNVL